MSRWKVALVAVILPPGAYAASRLDEPGRILRHCGDLDFGNCKQCETNASASFPGDCTVPEFADCCDCVTNSCSWPLRANMSPYAAMSSRIHVIVAYLVFALISGQVVLRISAGGRSTHARIGRTFYWLFAVMVAAFLGESALHVAVWMSDARGGLISPAIWDRSTNMLLIFLPLIAIAGTSAAGVFIRRPPKYFPQKAGNTKGDEDGWEVRRLRKRNRDLMRLSKVSMGMCAYASITLASESLSPYKTQESVFILLTLWSAIFSQAACQWKANREANAMLQESQELWRLIHPRGSADSQRLWKLIHIPHAAHLLSSLTLSLSHTSLHALDWSVAAIAVADCAFVTLSLVPVMSDLWWFASSKREVLRLESSESVDPSMAVNGKRASCVGVSVEQPTLLRSRVANKKKDARDGVDLTSVVPFEAWNDPFAVPEPEKKTSTWNEEEDSDMELASTKDESDSQGVSERPETPIKTVKPNLRRGRTADNCPTRSSIMGVMDFTANKEAVSGKEEQEDSALARLAEGGRRMRRAYFEEVGLAVALDEEGWPSVAALFKKPASVGGWFRWLKDIKLMEGSADVLLHPIEWFQRKHIYYHLGKTSVEIMAAQGIQWKLLGALIRRYVLGPFKCCHRRSEQADMLVLESPVPDDMVVGMFEGAWGCEMLRKPNELEDAFGISDAVICDTTPFIQDLEVKEGCWLEPCKIVFAQGPGGLKLHAIATDTQTFFAPNPGGESSESDDANWQWAKRMAISASLVVQQLCFHLVDHMAVETVVSLCYKHLAADHFVFQVLEPICGDVGFLNRTWGIENITAALDPWGIRVLFPICDMMPLTEKGVEDCVRRGKVLHEASRLFCFDDDGYFPSACGVYASTHFPYRDTGRNVFNTILKFVRSVVGHFWFEEDRLLEAWWQAIWWGHLAPSKRELTKEHLAHVLSQFVFAATYAHDVSHSRWLLVNHPYHAPMLRKGDPQKPETYLPTNLQHIITRLGMAGLMSDDLETPYTCYRRQFPEVPEAVAEYEAELRSIARTDVFVDKMGSMTH